MEYIFQIANFFIISFLSLFVFTKLLNASHLFTYKFIVAGVVFSGLLGYLAFLLIEVTPTISFISMLLLISAFAGKIAKIRPSLALTTSLLSMSISFGVQIMAATISAIFFYFVIRPESIGPHTILSALFSVAVLIFFFRIKRFRKGFPFLHNKWSGIVGVIFSGVILGAWIMLRYAHYRETGTLIVVGIVGCIAAIFFWCRKEIFNLYKQRIRERDQQEDARLAVENDAQIKAMQTETEIMAKRMNQENKVMHLMKEMLSSSVEINADVRFFYDRIVYMLREREKLVDSITVKQHADEIRTTHDAMAKIIHRDAKIFRAMQDPVAVLWEDNYFDKRTVYDRIGFLVWEHENIVDFPTSKNPLIDGILKHMMMKAAQVGVKMDFEMNCDLSELGEMEVSFLDFETVIADLLENAIIATADCEHKRILIIFSKDEGFFAIAVHDSGIPFESETLENLGKKPSSTHLHEGGSGIGYMSIFSIMSKYNASLIIHEFAPEPDGFTKSVAFRMDGKSSYCVLSDLKNEPPQSFHA